MEDSKGRGGKALLAAGILSIAVLSLALAGCSAGETLSKYNLTGQLEKLNQEVDSLNAETGELVDAIKILDEKEGQLELSLILLEQMNDKASSQISTTTALAGILEMGRLKVAGVLSLAQQVLAVEQGLKGDTQTELDLAGTTLHLIQSLNVNLESFKGINDQINSKLDQALQIMSNM